MFATIYVCGSIVSSSASTDGYIQPVPKTNNVVTYSDSSVYINHISTNDTVSHSDNTTKGDSSASTSTSPWARVAAVAGFMYFSFSPCSAATHARGGLIRHVGGSPA